MAFTRRAPLLGLMLCLGITHLSAAVEYFSPQNLVASPDGQRLYIAAVTADHIMVIDPHSDRLITTYSLPTNPNGLALSADGQRLFVTCGADNGQLLIITTRDSRVSAMLPTGHTPMSPVLSSDETRLYVCNRFNSTVAVFDLPSLKQTARVRVSREPVAAALGAGGRWLYVANHLPATRADQGVVAAVVSVIDTATGAVTREIGLPNGSTGLRGLCVSPDNKFVYVTHALGRYQMPTTQLDRGWMNTAALTIIDATTQQRVNTVLLDDVDLGAANPWGVACSPDGHWLLVAHAGTHELSVIDRPALHDKIARLTRGDAVSETSRGPEDVPNDLTFLVGLRQRVALSGKGPRELAVAGSRVFITSYFSQAIHVLDLAVTPLKEQTAFTLQPNKPMTQVRLGELYFHDAALCFQNWQSCASCHPDGRVDGLNWDLLNDGLGNPKNTKNMLLAHRTSPAMSLGIRETAEMAVRAGIRNIQFAVRPEEDARAIDEYLKALQPTPSPYRVKGQLSEAAKRGETLFQSAGCVACHPPPLFTDQKAYPIGTGTNAESNAEFDTPSLVEIWRTAPYLHDGRAATLLELFRDFNPGDRHGQTSRLTQGQLNDLIEFVLSQ